MRFTSICFLALGVTFYAIGRSSWHLAPSTPPSVQELREFGLSESATVRLIEFKSAEFRSEIKIYECMEPNRVCYVVRYGGISDFVCSGERTPSGDLGVWSRREVLEFFILRFKAIWSDVQHNKARPDVGFDLIDDGAKGDILAAFSYASAAEAMEKMLAEEIE